MDDRESKRIMREFWKTFDKEDIDGCGEILDACREEDLESRSIKAQMAIVLERHDIAKGLLEKLIDEFLDDNGFLSWESAEAYCNMIIEPLDKLMERGYIVSLPDFLENLGGIQLDRIYNGTDVYLPDVFRRMIADKIKGFKREIKINCFIGYYVYSLAAPTIHLELVTIHRILWDSSQFFSAVISRGSMSGHTEYAELVLKTIKSIESEISVLVDDCVRRGRLPDLIPGTDVGCLYLLFLKLSVHLVDPVPQEEIDERVTEFIRIMKENHTEGPLPKTEDIDWKKYLSLDDDDEDEDEDEDDEDEEVDLSAVSTGDLGPKADLDLLWAVSDAEPESADDVLKVAMALVTRGSYERSYKTFVDGLEKYPELVRHFRTLITHIADDLAYKYLNDRGLPSYGHVDIIASKYPDGPAEFFRFFGNRVMSHLNEAGSALDATNLPDAYAMYSRYIFDTYHIKGIDDMFVDIAAAYRETEQFILKNKRRFGANSQRYALLSKNAAVVYDAMAAYLKENLGDPPMFAVPSIFAGHDFDNAFAAWFQSRNFYSGAKGKRINDSHIQYMTGVLHGIIHGDLEDEEEWEEEEEE